MNANIFCLSFHLHVKYCGVALSAASCVWLTTF